MRLLRNLSDGRSHGYGASNRCRSLVGESVTVAILRALGTEGLMSERIVFYHNPMSRGRIVHWMLEEVGAPYKTVLLNLEKGEQKKPEYLAINPMGKIPAIVYRGTVVTE